MSTIIRAFSWIWLILLFSFLLWSIHTIDNKRNAMLWKSSKLIFFDHMTCKMLFVRTFSFWLVFLPNDETCSLKFHSWSILTPSNFSYLLLLTVSWSIFISKLSFWLFMRKRYLPGFAFIQLSLNHCNYSFSATFSNLMRTSEIFKLVQYGVMSSA